MKFSRITALIIALLVVGVFSADAQWDDVYFDPDKDIIVEDYNNNRYSSSNDNYRQDRYNDRYSSSYYNDYDFYYTSRIRRFHRPLYGFGYFDPFYIDTYYYDPFLTPGVTMLIYDDFYSRRAMAYGGFWNDPWMFNRFGFNRWNSFGFNNGFYGNSLAMRMAFGSPFGYFNSFNSFYCPPSWGNSYNYNNVTNYYSDTNSRGTSFTPRRGGSSLRPDVAQRGRTIDNGRNIEPPTIDGKRPYPYTPAGANGLKPTGRTPQLNTVDSRDRTRRTTYDPYVNPRSSRVNSNNKRTRTRTNSIEPSSRTRTRTINSNNSRTRTRSITPSRSNTSRSRVSPPSRTRSSSVNRSNNSSNSRSRSSSNNNSRSRGNNNG